MLEKAGLARAQTAGRECRYKLEPQVLDEARDYLRRVSKQWDEALGRLKAFVKKEDASEKLKS